MRLEQYSCHISLAILALTALYTLVYSGLTGLLFSMSIGLILMAFLEPFELVAAITVLVALLYTTVLKKYVARLEPFQDGSDAILHRVSSLASGSGSGAGPSKKHSGPMGVYSASAVEGFEDVQPDMPKDGASSDSSAASAMPIHQIDPKEVAEVTSAHPAEKKDKEEKGDKVIEKEEFQSATNELFKLGKMPSEHKEGPLLDVGQTVMKAMNSLDPNTISSMTADTKKLLETQKGLMSMLNQMRPVLADGRELLQTFSGMFGAAPKV
jgi:hypothetical protein